MVAQVTCSARGVARCTFSHTSPTLKCIMLHAEALPPTLDRLTMAVGAPS